MNTKYKEIDESQWLITFNTQTQKIYMYSKKTH